MLTIRGTGYDLYKNSVLSLQLFWNSKIILKLKVYMFIHIVVFIYIYIFIHIYPYIHILIYITHLYGKVKNMYVYVYHLLLWIIIIV